MSVRKILLPSISFIVARSYPDHVIGCENRLPWHLKSDLKSFKDLTKGKAIIMGRKTYESIGRPLPNRKNIVLTRNSLGLPSEVEVVNSVEEALYAADVYSILKNQNEFFVIGGDQIYRLFGEFYNRIYLTEVFAPNIDGDAHFEVEYDGRQWKTISEFDYPKSEGDEFPFRISILERKREFVRVLEVKKFFTAYSERLSYLNDVQFRNFRVNVEKFEVEEGVESQEDLFLQREYA